MNIPKDWTARKSNFKDIGRGELTETMLDLLILQEGHKTNQEYMTISIREKVIESIYWYLRNKWI